MVFRKKQNHRSRWRQKQKRIRATLQKANSIMLKLFEIEDETPPTVPDHSSPVVDRDTLSIIESSPWTSDSEITTPCHSIIGLVKAGHVMYTKPTGNNWTGALASKLSDPNEDSSNAKLSRQSFGLQNVLDSPPRRSLVHEDFELNEFVVTSEEICF